MQYKVLTPLQNKINQLILFSMVLLPFFLGAWWIGKGFVEGPLFYAVKQVEILDIHYEWYRNRYNEEVRGPPRLSYRFVTHQGETKEGLFKERWSGTPEAAKKAEIGDVVFLRIPVDREEPGSFFGVNQWIVQGIGLWLTLFVVVGHFRWYEHPYDARPWLQSFVLWNVLIWSWMWIALP
jgi:hypothetical protein